ncbi:MAG TPA: acetamidase/formamidase family protein [Trebonia sp.]|jgi:acetamidase/formamidase
MVSHQLAPAPETTVNHFSSSHTPRLTVDPGDTIVVGSLDASGTLGRHRYPGDAGQPRMFSAESRGHCLTGPIAVRGARPGDTLAVRIESLTPGDWGWTVSPGRADSPVAKRLGLTDPDGVSWLLWEIDAAAGTATANGKYTRPVAPFLGVTGTAPASPGPHSTIPPRAEAGGNIDCKELVAGSVLYLPVNVPGALLYLGDGHAAQGDGESCGTAIECPMTTTVSVSVATAPALDTIHAQTPAGFVTFGFSEDLNAATGDALDAMVTWLAAQHSASRSEALALASTCADLRVTQVANGTWGVHAVLPAGLLS